MMMDEKKILFEDILDLWLEEIRQTHALSTYVKYSCIVKNHIKPYFQEIPVNQIKTADLQKFSDDLKRPDPQRPHKKTCSPAMIQHVMMIVNRAMEMAFIQGFVDEWRHVPYRKRKKKTLVQVFSIEEQTKLENYIKKSVNQTGFGIYLCLYTGMRLGEICALKWENINLQEGYLTICATVQRLSIEQENGKKKSTLLISPPKSTSSLRQIPFPTFLLPVLRNQFKTTEKTDFLLVSKSQGPMDPRTFQYQYKRFLSKADVPYYNFHTLRHTFATRCITSGMDPKTLSEILGHADIKTTMEYYFHSSFEFKKNQIEKLSALV